MVEVPFLKGLPEIAEVALMAEAIRQKSLERSLLGVEVLGGRYSRQKLEGLAALQAALPLVVTVVQTKGKRCWLELANGWIIIISFGMSGGIYYQPDAATLAAQSQRSGKTISAEEYRKHFHLLFRVGAPAGVAGAAGEGEDCWYFGDPRQFGSIVMTTDRSVLSTLLDELGPDMLTGAEITDAEFIAAFRRFNRKNISAVLLEQKAVSGVGNYLRCEVLYLCRISPWAQVGDLSNEDLCRLHRAIRDTAAAAYQGHGASLYTYKGIRQEKGHFQEALQVYNRDKDPLGRSVIHMTKGPAGRGVYYVPEHQTIGAHRCPIPVVPTIAPVVAPIVPVIIVTVPPPTTPVVTVIRKPMATSPITGVSTVRLVTPKFLSLPVKKDSPEEST